MYSPLQIADKFIELGIASGTPITQMQAQKLTYIAHGCALGHRGEGILSDPVCAWRYGPVLPALYHALKHHGSAPIRTQIPQLPFYNAASIQDEYVNGLINSVFRTYGRYDASVLSEFTHREGTPWRKTYDAGKSIIDNKIIEDYYKRLMSHDSSCIGL